MVGVARGRIEDPAAMTSHIFMGRTESAPQRFPDGHISKNHIIDTLA